MKLSIKQIIRFAVQILALTACDSVSNRIDTIAYKCGIETPDNTFKYIKILGSDSSEREQNSLELLSGSAQITSKGCLAIPKDSTAKWFVAAREFDEGAVYQNQPLTRSGFEEIILARYRYAPIPAPCDQQIATNEKDVTIDIKSEDHLREGYDITVFANEVPFSNFLISENNTLVLNSSTLAEGIYSFKIEIRERYSKDSSPQTFTCPTMIDRTEPTFEILSASGIKLVETDQTSIEPSSALQINSTQVLAQESYSYCIRAKDNSDCLLLQTRANLIQSPGEGDWILEITGSDLAGNTGKTQRYDLSVQNPDKVRSIFSLLDSADAFLQTNNALDAAINVMKSKTIFDNLKSDKDKALVKNRLHRSLIQIQAGMMESYKFEKSPGIDRSIMAAFLDDKEAEVQLLTRQSTRGTALEWIGSDGSFRNTSDVSDSLEGICQSANEMIFKIGSDLQILDSKGIRGSLEIKEGLIAQPAQRSYQDCNILIFFNPETGETTIHNRKDKSFQTIDRPLEVHYIESLIFGTDMDGQSFQIDPRTSALKELTLFLASDVVSYSDSTQLTLTFNSKDQKLVAYDAQWNISASYPNIVSVARASEKKMAAFDASGRILVIDSDSAKTESSLQLDPGLNNFAMGKNVIAGLGAGGTEVFVWDIRKPFGKRFTSDAKVQTLTVGPTDIVYVETESSLRAYDLKNYWNSDFDNQYGEIMSVAYCPDWNTLFSVERTKSQNTSREDLVIREINKQTTRIELGRSSYRPSIVEMGQTIACLKRSAQVLIGRPGGKVSLVDTKTKEIIWTRDLPQANGTSCSGNDISHVVLNDEENKALLLAINGAAFELDISSQKITQKASLFKLYGPMCRDSFGPVQFTSALYLSDRSEILLGTNRGSAYLFPNYAFDPDRKKELVIPEGGSLKVTRVLNNIIVGSKRGLFAFDLSSKPIMKPHDRVPSLQVESYVPTEIDLGERTVVKDIGFLDSNVTSHLWISAKTYLNISGLDWQDTDTYVYREDSPPIFASVTADSQSLLIGFKDKISTWSLNPSWVEMRFCTWVATRIRTIKLNRQYSDLSICGL